MPSGSPVRGRALVCPQAVILCQCQPDNRSKGTIMAAQLYPSYRMLVAMDTITQSHDADLKLVNASNTMRWWLHRTGIADGEPFEHTVTVEIREHPRGPGGSTERYGDWHELCRYDGDSVRRVLKPDQTLGEFVVTQTCRVRAVDEADALREARRVPSSEARVTEVRL